MGTRPWRELAAEQAGLLARWQFADAGVTRAFARHQVGAGRWVELTHTVVGTVTGPLSWEQRLWLGVLHAGPKALVGGLTAAAQHGLTGWDREAVTVLVDDELSFDEVDGVRFFRTRRDLGALRSARSIPTCRLEPAVLLYAGYWPVTRTAHGAIAACVQQRLSTPERFREWVDRLKPLRGAKGYRALLSDLDGGAHSVAEIDVRRACKRFGVAPPARQRSRQDRDGKRRWTDCEWDLPGGKVLVLEVDGGFHLEVLTYGADMKRQRKLTTRHRTIVRCAAEELRHDPGAVMVDLIDLGVPRAA
jgi:hypothetical protein